MEQYKAGQQKQAQTFYQIVCGYANGRFAEIQNLGKIKYQFTCDAEDFIEQAKSYGLKVVSYPTLGGIMVWQKGATLNHSDGAGHVAIVERIDGKDKIYTSESAYASTAFYNSIRTNSNGRWGMNSNYKFRGCIINPAIGDVHWKEEAYKVNSTYTTQVILKVRTDAGINNPQVSYERLTENAKKHAYPTGANKGCLKVGTKITCLEIKKDNNNTWIRIPSGWIAGIYNNKVYVK